MLVNRLVEGDEAGEILTMDKLNKLTSWRTEHMGDISIDQKIEIQSRETPEEKKRIRTAFLMGVDPLKFRSMKTLPGQEPEMHRVTVFMDSRGEFEVEFHRLLGEPSAQPDAHPGAQVSDVRGNATMPYDAMGTPTTANITSSVAL